MTNETFNKKWDKATFEDAYQELNELGNASTKYKSYINDCFDMFETEGFLDTFVTPYDQYADYNGQKYELIRRCTTEDGWDLEILPAWKIRFNDGYVIDAWPEEICKIERA